MQIIPGVEQVKVTVTLTGTGATAVVVYPVGTGSVRHSEISQIPHGTGSGYFPSKPHCTGKFPFTKRGFVALLKLEPGTQV